MADAAMRRRAGAIAGGLAAGLGITALLLVQERRAGKPSELADLARTGAARLDIATPPGDALPAPGEQAIVQGGHLVLSALAAAAYAAASDEDSDVLVSGLAFGAAFYVAMHWITGPVLGVKAPEWRSDPATLAMHTLNHLAFGLATAAGARLAQKGFA